eukprot:3875845-Amphidinium_carterae.2
MFVVARESAQTTTERVQDRHAREPSGHADPTQGSIKTQALAGAIAARSPYFTRVHGDSGGQCTSD